MAFGINDNMSVSIGEPIIPTEIDGRTIYQPVEKVFPKC
jgi:hypothetical protein